MARISTESAKFFVVIGLAALGVSHSAWAKSPAPIQIAANLPPGQTGIASVNAIRVGVHPDKMRIVLDISGPTDMGFEVADDGKAVIINMPAAVWKAGEFTTRHSRAMLSEFLYTPSESGGGRLSLFMKRPVRIERPFLVPPKGKRGYRLVIDAVAAKAAANTAQRQPVPQASPPSQYHQLVGASVAGNDQLPPATTQLASAQMAQTRMPPPRMPYQVPVQRPRQMPGQFPQQMPAQSQPFPRQPAAQPFPGQLPPGVVTPQQPIRTLDQAAQTIDNLFYGRALLGGIFAREAEMTGSGNTNSTEFDAGFNGAAAIGIDLKNGFRAEAEFIYTNSSVKSITGTANAQSISTGNVTGNLITYSGMGNLVMDLPPQSLLTPYVFAGVGVSGVFLDGVNSSGAALYNSDDFVFAMQFGAGVTMPLDDKITLEASYRFFNTFDPELQDASGDPVTFEYSSHNFMFGARYAF
ncbi:MAG: outer membrane beta-barrel protein [Rhodospirillaceae bacterium]|jgi:opacity protein-like surface antigen|nr:outer membrane beta-barrel protein [Rhodospirillaceae bacterium]MBT3885542.1 outer membrane beta-barrel protein [Rhodospirillaceae bacterium]MBT4117553.1 outer membrane beta-barrel protein [Rhodospirillaceae bacterium]MBT4671621.1 outer membrane beta-barrel protein [Rhodospirillaceae bacterium]MBT4717858.1 outer membrane beta-barrel protein [Rhodospirillaceae bacterium]